MRGEMGHLSAVAHTVGGSCCCPYRHLGIALARGQQIPDINAILESKQGSTRCHRNDRPVCCLVYALRYGMSSRCIHTRFTQ